MKIRCTTQVDITPTGVKNRFYKSQMPFRDKTGRLIDNETAWQQSRAQQSNWETVNQLLSLRTIPENVTEPVCSDSTWVFEFDIEDSAAIGNNEDPIALLKTDFDGVPVAITGANSRINMLKTGENSNVRFEVIG